MHVYTADEEEKINVFTVAEEQKINYSCSPAAGQSDSRQDTTAGLLWGGQTKAAGARRIMENSGWMWTVRKSVWRNIWKSGETFDATPKICGHYFPPKVQKS